jgi:hypothetical protein
VEHVLSMAKGVVALFPCLLYLLHIGSHDDTTLWLLFGTTVKHRTWLAGNTATACFERGIVALARIWQRYQNSCLLATSLFEGKN